MKNYFETIGFAVIPFVLGMFAAYLVGSFINVSFDPALWEHDSRVFMSIVGLCCGTALYVKLIIWRTL